MPSGGTQQLRDRKLVKREMQFDSEFREITGPRTSARSDSYPVVEVPRLDDSGLMEYWRVLYRRKLFISSMAVLAALGAFLITLAQPRIYRTNLLLEVQDMNPEISNLTRGAQGAQPYSALPDIQTQLRILDSDSLRERALAKLGYSEDDTKRPQPVNLWAALFDSKAARTPKEVRNALLVSAAKSMQVREVGPTRIIELLVESPDRKLSADFANTLADEFIDDNIEARWKMSQRTGDWLGQQMDGMRLKLERSEYALQDYAKTAGLLFTGTEGEGGKTNISEDRLRQIQESLSAATSDRVAKESRYAIASSNPPETLPDVLNDPTLREYAVKLTDLRRQLDELSAIYTPDFPKVKRLRGQVDTVQAAFERQRTAVLAKVKNEFNEAALREKELQHDYEVQAHAVTADSEKTIKYDILKREVDSNRQLYEAMLQRVKESGVAAALKASNIRVVDPAKPPILPYRPKVALDMAMGLFLGAFFGAGYALTHDRTDRSIRAPGDSPKWLNVPELGVMPTGSKSLTRRDGIERVTMQLKSQIMAVLTSIIFSSENGASPRLIVLTSPGPSEGKTTVASNLAFKLAGIGKKVLLIDADLFRARLHDLFGISNDHGLTTVLQSEPPDENLLQSAIQKVSEGLFVLPCGPPALEAGDLLFASHMPDLLSRLRTAFDMIIIDTPPLSVLPDARILGRFADGVVLVIRAGHTTRDGAMAAIQRLMNDRTNVLGTVLNDWNPKKSPGGYYAPYGMYANKKTGNRSSASASMRGVHNGSLV